MKWEHSLGPAHRRLSLNPWLRIQAIYINRDVTHFIPQCTVFPDCSFALCTFLHTAFIAVQATWQTLHSTVTSSLCISFMHRPRSDWKHSALIRYKHNVSVNNTTLYFIYNKNSILSGQHVSTFIMSSSGPLGKQIKSYLYFNALWDPKCLQMCVSHSYNTICKHLESHNALRAWRWPNKSRNISLWQYIIFIVYKIKCCITDWHVVFICYNT